MNRRKFLTHVAAVPVAAVVPVRISDEPLEPLPSDVLPWQRFLNTVEVSYESTLTDPVLADVGGEFVIPGRWSLDDICRIYGLRERMVEAACTETIQIELEGPSDDV